MNTSAGDCIPTSSLIGNLEIGVLIFCLFFGGIGNLLVIILVAFRHDLHRVHFAFLAHLAVCDLLTVLISGLFSVFELYFGFACTPVLGLIAVMMCRCILL